MESKNRRLVTWNEIRQLVSKLDPTAKYYGVPRGGCYIAAMLNPVDYAQDADYIIDDIIDSGETERRYKKQYPGIPFIALFKATPNEWLVFPWEVVETPVTDNITRVLQYLGEDPQREGLRETPKRYIKFLEEFLMAPDFKFTTFDNEQYDAMVISGEIPFFSLCEHHLAPFFGSAYIGYVPDKKIVGISKLPRTLEKFARRLQNQERITTQVANELMAQLNAKGVAVVIKARHLCQEMRGVKKAGVITTTSCMLGVFKDDLNARNEFLKLI